MKNENTELVSNSSTANPKRVAAGKRNWLKRRGVSDAGRERQRLAALKHRPWQYSTGPRTAVGKAKSARNGKQRQLGLVSLRELKTEMRIYRAEIVAMREDRESVGL